MAYSEKLADRIRTVLADSDASVVEKKMFGGLTFMVADHMACGVIGDQLMVRVGPDAWDDAITQPHCEPCEFVGKPMKGIVVVGAGGVRTRQSLARWVGRGAAFALSLPPKKLKAGKKKAARAKAAKPARTRAKAT